MRKEKSRSPPKLSNGRFLLILACLPTTCKNTDSQGCVSIDFSGLVQWCYGKAGISLPRTAQAQYDATQHLPLSQAKAGDLVFFHSTYNAGSYVTHVGIYVGNNQMYHAGDPIGYADLSSSYWQQHLIGAGRVKQ